jgi:DNA (cytosine-5)-methyltransferase 1
MTSAKQLFHVDLFAGCGGLSLGLEDSRFTPVYVSELNADALTSYLRNRTAVSPHLEAREFHCDDVKHLVRNKGASLNQLEKSLRARFRLNIDYGDLDLIVGGPPCQGFSGIGHRRSYSVDKKQLPSNHLYQDMAFIVARLKPKIFLFENVKGLLSAKWTADGQRGEIWRDVYETFHSLSEYSIDHGLVRACDYGVPQNRPRVLLVGIRRDIKERAEKRLKSGIAGGFLPSPTGGAPDLQELLGDLIDPEYQPGATTTAYPCRATCDLQRELRTVKEDGRCRTLRKGEELTEHTYSKHSDRIQRKFRAMLDNDGEIPASFRTKKFAQRLLLARWGREGPTITATSLPDDYVHFAQPRTLTVREWARLQMFPDWYQFAGKRTTGGLRRAGNPREGCLDREVPKYTQIGNAVPVGLARALGRHFRSILTA